MKRFVTAAVLLLAIGIGAYWAIFYGGFYMRFRERAAMDVTFRAEGTQLQARNGQDYVPLILRGVTYPPAFRGTMPLPMTRGRRTTFAGLRPSGTWGLTLSGPPAL